MILDDLDRIRRDYERLKDDNERLWRSTIGTSHRIDRLSSKSSRPKMNNDCTPMPKQPVAPAVTDNPWHEIREADRMEKQEIKAINRIGFRMIRNIFIITFICVWLTIACNIPNLFQVAFYLDFGTAIGNMIFMYIIAKSFEDDN